MLKRFLYLGLLLLAVWQSAQAEVANTSGINAFLSQDEETFLSPDEAFKLQIQPIDHNTLQAKFAVAPSYYLYKERIKFAIEDPAQGQVKAIDLPVGEIKDDPNFGKLEIYHQDFVANVKLENAAKNVLITATYQGCSEKGLCYPPQHKTFNLALNADNAAEPSDLQKNVAPQSQTDQTTAALQSGKLGLIVAGFFVAGLLLSLTPCVLPMIPILSSIIVGSQSKNKHNRKGHAFALSVAYVLGMALSYSAAGVAAGLSGNLLSQSLQNTWVLAATALLFVVLACSMFGLYELRLPSQFENKILSMSNRFKGGEFLGVFVMGALSALIVSPCVAAPLAGALIYIGQSHHVFLGGVALFALAIGMGVPLLLIGASAGSLVPKAGAWMTLVRNFFGVVMLLMAAYIAWPILPNSFTQPVNQLLGLQVAHPLPFKRIHTTDELDAAINTAGDRLVMLDFYADWCVACKEMERNTFSDAKVRDLLKNAVLLQADVTANNADDAALLKRFNLFGPPGILFFHQQRLLTGLKVVGYKNAAEFTQIIQQAATH